MRVLGIALLTLAACTEHPSIVVDHASALTGWDLDGSIWWNPAPELSFYFGPKASADPDCHVLGDDVVATLDGDVIGLDHGGLVPDPNYADGSHLECSGPHFVTSVPAADTAPGSSFDLVIRDATAEIHVSLVDPFATRTIALDGGGSLVPGTTATIRWSPTTDDLEPLTTNGIPAPIVDTSMDCTPPIFPGVFLRTSDGTLIKDGNAFSFSVPSTNNQHYTLACTLGTMVYATITACDFASCKLDYRLLHAYDYPFTLTI
jgi:hypothetical protein